MGHLHFQEAEYCDMKLVLAKSDLENFIGQLAAKGVSLHWKDRQDRVVLIAMTGVEKREFLFYQHEGQFVLTGTVVLHDQRLVNALQLTLVRTKGSAVVKHFTEGMIVISTFQNGEAMKIMELNGPRKKVVYEKPVKVTSEDVMNALKNKELEARIPALKLEMDYELVSLSDALQAGDEEEIQQVKVRLEAIRRELMVYEVFAYQKVEVENEADADDDK